MSAIKHFINWSAVGLSVASIMNWMPAIAGFLSAVWMSITLLGWWADGTAAIWLTNIKSKFTSKHDEPRE